MRPRWSDACWYARARAPPSPIRGETVHRLCRPHHVAGGQEVGRANIFVAALVVSGYCFCLATPAQTAVDWLGATAHALAFYGGAPQLIVPDNPCALVTPAERYEPVWCGSCPGSSSACPPGKWQCCHR